MKNTSVVVEFANVLNKELIEEFLNSKSRSKIHTITLTYQMDISYELKNKLRNVMKLGVSLEEVEECINENCSREVLVHVFELSAEQICLQILKTPKCRIN